MDPNRLRWGRIGIVLTHPSHPRGGYSDQTSKTQWGGAILGAWRVSPPRHQVHISGNPFFILFFDETKNKYNRQPKTPINTTSPPSPFSRPPPSLFVYTPRPLSLPFTSSDSSPLAVKAFRGEDPLLPLVFSSFISF